MDNVLRLEQEYNFVKGQVDEGSLMFQYFESMIATLHMINDIKGNFSKFNTAMSAVVSGDTSEDYNEVFANTLNDMYVKSKMASEITNTFTDKRIMRYFNRLNHQFERFTKGLRRIGQGRRVKNFGYKYQKPLDEAIMEVLNLYPVLVKMKDEIKLEILQ